MSRVHVYTKDELEDGLPCLWCQKVKEWLLIKSIPFTYEELNKESRERLYNEFELEGEKRTVPQVVLIDEHGEEQRIGGYMELEISGLESLFPGST